MAKLGPLALAAIAAAFSGWARAADLPPAPSLPPASAAEEEFSGWYLRGDVGGGVNAAAPKLEITPGPLAGPIATPSGLSPVALALRHGRCRRRLSGDELVSRRCDDRISLRRKPPLGRG